MANRLSMDKSLAVMQLSASGYSERRIAETTGISRGAVRRHLGRHSSNSTKAQTGSTETPAEVPEARSPSTGSPVNIESPMVLLGAYQVTDMDKNDWHQNQKDGSRDDRSRLESISDEHSRKEQQRSGKKGEER